MGLPYSRQINAAFEQVTPLVAAGFKVLRTTRDISILLAVIQVLTVGLLGAILVMLGVLVVCVNEDLVEERQRLITPLLKRVLRITLWSVVTSVFYFGLFVATAAAVLWKGVLAKKWVEDVEYEGNVDAERALEELDGEEGGGKEGKGGK